MPNSPIDHLVYQAQGGAKAVREYIATGLLTSKKDVDAFLDGYCASYGKHTEQAKVLGLAACYPDRLVLVGETDLELTVEDWLRQVVLPDIIRQAIKRQLVVEGVLDWNGELVRHEH